MSLTHSDQTWVYIKYTTGTLISWNTLFKTRSNLNDCKNMLEHGRVSWLVLLRSRSWNLWCWTWTRASQEGGLSHSTLFMTVIYQLGEDPICVNMFNVGVKMQNDAPWEKLVKDVWCWKTLGTLSHSACLNTVTALFHSLMFVTFPHFCLAVV